MMERLNTSRRGFLSRFGRVAMAGGAAFGLASTAGAREPKRRRRSKRVAFKDPTTTTSSRAVKYEDTIYLSGVYGTDRRGRVENDFELQAGRALLNLKEALERSQSSIHSVLQCTCYLTTAQYCQQFDKIYVDVFPSSPPARSVVIVKELPIPGAKVLIDCICHV